MLASTAIYIYIIIISIIHITVIICMFIVFAIILFKTSMKIVVIIIDIWTASDNYAFFSL